MSSPLRLGLAVLAVAAVVAPASAGAAPAPRSFQSPGGDIHCLLEQGRMMCQTQGVQHTAMVLRRGPATPLAAGDVLPGGRTVAAGRTVSVGGAFSCTVRPASVTCVSMDTGNGFSISRAGVKTFTPPPGGY